VLTKGADNGNGDIFLAPQSGGQYGTGPEIVSITGKVLWFHRLPAGTFATDFRTQTYLGKPVLTWFQGSSTGGEDVIYNARYQQIATVKPANGYLPDFHEFLITPWNTALILADTIGTANLTSLGLSAHQQVMDGVVQEIDIKTGKLLFQWVSSDHVPYSDSHAPMPQPGQPWDWFHINAVHLDTDGNLLISSRFTWTIYKVNLRTGAMMWQLGGRHSTFAIKAAPGQKLDSAGEIFAFQHDPEALGGNVYTVFDDESDGQSTLYSILVQPRGHNQPGPGHRHGDADQVREPAGGPDGGRDRQRADDQERRPVRQLGRAVILLRVQPVRKAAVQRQAPRRRGHLPRLPAAVEPGQLACHLPGCKSIWSVNRHD
jgi:Arylsulfotransferase (ASST)